MSAYNRIMTNAEIDEMEKNRLQMISIKRWFEFAIAYETVCSLYMSTFIGAFALIAGLIYIFTINRKKKSIIWKAIVINCAVSLISVIASIVDIGDALAMSKNPASQIAGQVGSELSSLPEEAFDIQQTSGEKVGHLILFFAIVNLICSLAITIPPIIINIKLLKKCEEYYLLKNKPGFPAFSTYAEIKESFLKSEKQRIADEYNPYIGYKEEVMRQNVIPAGPIIIDDVKKNVQDNNATFVYKAFNNEGAEYLKKIISEYRDQITKKPENIYDYTVLSSFFVIFTGFIELHVSSVIFAFLEALILIFVLLPKKIDFLRAALIVHVLECIMVVSAGQTQDGWLGIVTYCFVCFMNIVQTIMYFMTYQMLRTQRDEKLEEIERERKEYYESERIRKIRETEERYKRDIENRKISLAQETGMPLPEPAPVASGVPEQNYSSWSKVDTDLVSSMLSDLNE